MPNQIRTASIERVHFKPNLWNPTICSVRTGYCIGRDIDFIILSEPFNLKKPELVNKALLSGYINDRSLIWKSKSWFLKPPFYENVRSVTSHVRTHFYCTSLLNLLGWSEILYSFRFGYNFWLGQSKWKICITSRRSSYSQSKKVCYTLSWKK